MIRHFIPLCFAVLVIGCQGQSTPPQPAFEDSLVGLSLEEFRAKLGPPDSESQGDRPFDFGPNPASLVAGDPYTYLYYSDYQGEQVHVFLVSPGIYKQVKGEHPGDGELYVLEVFTYPKGTVF
jgi:hypothetical protein